MNGLIVYYFYSRMSIPDAKILNFHYIVGCGDPDPPLRQQSELDHMVRNEITYNAVIAGLWGMEREDEASSMFIDMENVGLKPTELTFLSVVGASCLVFEGLEVKDSVAWNAIIASYSLENLGTHILVRVDVKEWH
ncbi:pentatricopeptide repeat-containing protein-like [Dorcoceras hygrometricum]|uniref:Pentatricopeptide repeat-containing protein-like n=1 Tax=Dorcoceras hygrometricum TaxID=472368 RepID=A0A2Z7D3W0_9LAMI|nr:pentatricopeptide repeat-containing protein-like [Dorcoceras hygrometricum]